MEKVIVATQTRAVNTAVAVKFDGDQTDLISSRSFYVSLRIITAPPAEVEFRAGCLASMLKNARVQRHLHVT